MIIKIVVRRFERNRYINLKERLRDRIFLFDESQVHVGESGLCPDKNWAEHQIPHEGRTGSCGE